MDVYNGVIASLGLSPINTSLLVIIFMLARQRYLTQEEAIEKQQKLTDRIERSLIRAGIELMEMED